jgi:hypothetical protein
MYALDGIRVGLARRDRSEDVGFDERVSMSPMCSLNPGESYQKCFAFVITDAIEFRYIKNDFGVGHR